MPYFPLQPRSACSSKDAAQPTCLQAHFVLFNDLILAPALCSASDCPFSAAQHIKLGTWFTWEKNALCPPVYSSPGSVSQNGPLDGHRNNSASLSIGLLWGQEQAAGGQGYVLRQISSFNQIPRCLYLHQCLPSGRSRNKGQRKKGLQQLGLGLTPLNQLQLLREKKNKRLTSCLHLFYFSGKSLKKIG